ncbi:MAG TPA: DNA-directed RNA polymerase subunit B [Candidatus Poseidoniales archaeon]|nr:DNA-directed RNA polymerase subunit B [Candidatus Poseidoniales archaeon]
MTAGPSAALVNHQLGSFNDFLPHDQNPAPWMQRVVDNISVGADEARRGAIRLELGDLDVIIELGKIRIGRPIVYEANGSQTESIPMMARLRNMTYSAPVYLEFTIVEEGMEIEEVEEEIGNMPVMVKSMLCNLHRHYLTGEGSSDDDYKNALKIKGEDPQDPGGYFIVNGTERVLVCLEDLAPNRVMVENEQRYQRKTELAKVFSQREGFRALTVVEKKKDGILQVSIPVASGQVPLAVLMMALGMESADDIMQAITNDPEMQNLILANIEEIHSTEGIYTTQEALEYMERRFAAGQSKEYRKKRINYILDNTLLPHLNTTYEARLKKAVFLGRMAREVLELNRGQRKPDDKDHYANKRLKLAGNLMEELFRSGLQALLNDMKYQMERSYSKRKENRIHHAVRRDVLTNKIMHAMATGNWTGGRAGVSQLLDRTCNMATLSHLRRVISPLTRSQPHFEARDLHPTQFGRLCPNETPEGQNCGLVKNLALMVDVSENLPDAHIRKVLDELDIHPIEEGEAQLGKVYFNGDLIGTHESPVDLVTEIRQRRRKNMISNVVNVRYDDSLNDVIINSDPGRIRRPLLVVGRNNRLNIKERDIDSLQQGKSEWDDLLNKGIVEYIDAEEEENCLIALNEDDLERNKKTHKYSHMEVDPMTILGVATSNVPFPEHNSSPRCTMGAGMSKQSLGLGQANYRTRPDTRGHLLHYAERPMLQTEAMKYNTLRTRPAGQNMVVAVMSYHGYNMEDALIFNQGSIDRGIGRSTFVRTYMSEERRYPGGQEDRFVIPGPDVRGARSEEAYFYLEEDGLIYPEIDLSGKEVLIGKTSPPRFLSEPTDFLSPQKVRESSLTVRHGEKGTVDSVMLSETENGSRIARIRVRDQRVPEMGDKFASRHGQKGVIGHIVPAEGMPFTEQGITPDLIINPHAIPSRMTVAHLLEMIGGKVGSMEGRAVDGSAFSGEKENDLRTSLAESGFRHSGREVLYDGQTGRRIDAEIFIGVIYYQKLHHMVSGKLHARSRGPVQLLTRQPTEGRARMGGLRFGEMERDCLIAHGAAMVIKDRLLDESDKTVQFVDSQSGHIGYLDRRGVLTSPMGDNTSIYPVTMSYAFKLLLEELKSLGIAARLRLEDLS